MDNIIKNQIRCKKCGAVIESHYGHDFRFCPCGAVAVDGGHYFLRRVGNPEDYEELSICDRERKVGDNKMPRLKEYYFARLDRIINNVTNQPYANDWCCDHVAKCGLLCIYESLNVRPGEIFCIFNHDDYPGFSGFSIPYIRTFYGEFLEDTEEKKVFKTQNSTYYFSIGEFDITDVQKEELLMNIIGLE